MRYVLITWLPLFKTENGRYMVDIDGWYWELKAYVKLYKDFHVFAPLKEELIPDSEDLRNVFSEDEITFHPLPYFENKTQFLLNLPKIISIVNRDIKKDDLVHNKATAIPPIGHVTNFICMLKGYQNRLIIYDADFLADLDLYRDSSTNIFYKAFYYLLKQFYSPIFKFSIKNTPLTFVGGEYLLEKYENEGNVIKYNTSWVQKKDIISHEKLREKLEKCSYDYINLCFVATLIPKKNPECAIKAAKILKDMEIPFKLNILPIPYRGRVKTIENEVEELIEKYDLSNEVEIWGILPYGDPFYEALREHDAILVPNLSGEEPRIIYDAMANGTVVIGSNLKSFSIISPDFNGLLCDPEDPLCFAKAIEKLHLDRKFLKEMAHNGLNTIEKNSMEIMHQGRKKYIVETFKKADLSSL